MLTALYDLDVSPLTFDFVHALIQAEVRRRQAGHSRLRMHVKRARNLSDGAYSPDEAEWRLRHIIAPMCQLLEQPAELVISEDPPESSDVMTASGGLHWLSDVNALAAAGRDVQLIKASAAEIAEARMSISEFVGARDLITITLRETNYASARNSNLLAWASLARQIPRDRFAVAVLRDHERIFDPLPGEWGELVPASGAVWSLQRRVAIYTLAWLNLGNNNGPTSLLSFCKNARYLTFKLFGGTAETSINHFLRLGVRPYFDFPYAQPGQHLVWEEDTIEVLTNTVLPIVQHGRFPKLKRPKDPVGCLVEASRRDFRYGVASADTLSRIPETRICNVLAFERVTMLVDEGRLAEASAALAELPDTETRQNLIETIEKSACSPDDLASITATQKQQRDATDGEERQTELKSFAQRQTRDTQPVFVSTQMGPDLAIRRLATAVLLADGRPLEIKVCGELASAVSMTSMFAPVRTIHLAEPSLSEVCSLHEPLRSACLVGLAQVSARANALLAHWREREGVNAAPYIVTALNADTSNPNGVERLRALQGPHSQVVSWNEKALEWPLEMLAALLSNAAICVLEDPLAIAIADLIAAPWIPSACLDEPEFEGPTRAAMLATGMLECAKCVCAQPELPLARAAFARIALQLNVASGLVSSVNNNNDLSLFVRAMCLTLQRGGRSAHLVEPVASQLVLKDSNFTTLMVDASLQEANSFFERLENISRYQGPARELLSALCSGTKIFEPELLFQLEQLRRATVDAALQGHGQDSSRHILDFLKSLRDQVWIGYGDLDVTQGIAHSPEMHLPEGDSEFLGLMRSLCASAETVSDPVEAPWKDAFATQNEASD